MANLSPEVRRFADLAGSLQPGYSTGVGTDPWEGSPFEWIRRCPPAQKGAIAAQLISEWCRTQGVRVAKSGDSDADRVIGGRRVEIKMSTLWESGIYKFQQIRDQNYDYVICLGLSPFDVHCWVILKEVIREHTPPQHGGKRGKDTQWLSFRATAPPAWLGKLGGDPARAMEIIRALAR